MRIVLCNELCFLQHKESFKAGGFYTKYDGNSEVEYTTGYSKKTERRSSFFMSMFENEVSVFCKSLGFKEVQVRKIKTVLKEESDLSQFKMYIIMNDGKFKSNLELIYNYLNLVKCNKYSYKEFSNDYNNDKAHALKNISKGMYNSDVLHNVEYLIKKGLTLKEIYVKVVDGKFNISQTLTELKFQLKNI